MSTDTQWFANKAKMINVVSVSKLDAKDKMLLVSLIMSRNPTTGRLDPGVARLCKVRGIKDTKNFKGLDTYLPGLVTVHRTPGKKNSYSLNDSAIMALPEAEVKLTGNNYTDHPAVEGYTGVTAIDHPALEANPPSVEGYYPPSVEGYYPPSVEGANSKVESKEESKLYNREMSELSSSVENDQGSSLAETNTPLVSSGQDYKEILVEEIAVLSSGETKSPGYSSVTSKEEEISSGMAIVNEDDLGKTDKVQKAMEEYRAKKAKRSAWQVPSKKAAPSKKSLDVVDAPQSLVEAKEAPEVQTVPEKPQKPVQHVPERTQWDDDYSYESKVHKADMAFTLAMGKWKQDLKVWENKYGSATTTQAPAQSSPEPMRFRAQAY